MNRSRNIPKWNVIGESVRGDAHVHKSIVNQDSIKWAPQCGGDCYAIMAVSDGHGAARHFRSDRGARIAVDETIVMLEEFWKAHKKKSKVDLSSIKNFAEETMLKRLHRNWKEKVMADIASDPVTESELERLKEKTPAPVNDHLTKPLSAYGATLLALLVTPIFRLSIRLGDGDLLAVTEEGMVHEILPDEDLGDEVESLSMPDAWRFCDTEYHNIGEHSPVMYLLSTDGYSKSFNTKADFLQIGPDYLRMLKESGKDEVSNNIKHWLEKTSQEGSGDDITLGIVFRETLKAK